MRIIREIVILDEGVGGVAGRCGKSHWSPVCGGEVHSSESCNEEGTRGVNENNSTDLHLSKCSKNSSKLQKKKLNHLPGSRARNINGSKTLTNSISPMLWSVMVGREV